MNRLSQIRLEVRSLLCFSRHAGSWRPSQYHRSALERRPGNEVQQATRDIITPMQLDAIQPRCATPASTAGSSTTITTAIPSPRASSASTRRRTSRAAGTTSSPPRASRASWCIASSRAGWTRCPAQRRVYSSWQELHAGLDAMLAGRAPHRHAVLAQQRHHVCLHGRCRHGRVPARAGQADRQLGRPGEPV